MFLEDLGSALILCRMPISTLATNGRQDSLQPLGIAILMWIMRLVPFCTMLPRMALPWNFPGDFNCKDNNCKDLGGEELIMLNSIFSQSTVKNYTLGDNQFHLGATVGVFYEPDMKKVIKVLEETSQSIPWRLPEPDPRVLLQDFGDSAVIFGVYFNVEEHWQQRVHMSDLRKAIWFAFKEADITIAFDQVNNHFDPPVEEAFTGLKNIK